MNIYLDLFLSFFEIGVVSFGGGYGMLSLMREIVLSKGWLSEDEIMNFIAVSESTPGPIAINMATFIGSSKGNVLGAVCATLGVVLPAFIIILIVTAILKNLLKYPSVNAFLGGVRPCVSALIISTAITMGLSTLFSITTIKDTPIVSVKQIIILAIILAIHFFIKYVLKKKTKPILMIIISAFLGIIIYSI